MATFDKTQVIQQGSLEEFATWAECYKVYQLPNGYNFIAIRSERDEQSMFGSQHCEGAKLVWERGKTILFDWDSLLDQSIEQIEPKTPENVKIQTGQPGARKQKLLDAVTLLWELRAKRRNETAAQADPSFWAFLDESHLEMELQQGLATLNDDGRARVQVVLN